jgi:cellobiose epimerase
MRAVATHALTNTLLPYKAAVQREMDSILSWWMKYMIDERGGFYGSVNNSNEADLTAPKGIVLNSRILWAFSAAYVHSGNESHLNIAQRAFDYILDHFVDAEYGGVYWSVNAQGKKNDEKKQVYGQAFCIYGMAEYYKASGNVLALHVAKELFKLTEHYSFDKQQGGYIEAFTRKWQAADDLRLSDKDANERKTMNTHLHLIEAYAGLYAVWPDEILQEKIVDLLEAFDQHIISNRDAHLHLFMDEYWEVRSSLVSFGHDIEAAWLLLECAETINDQSLIDRYKMRSVAMANAAARGRDADGGLWYEYEPTKKQWIKEKHSWPQAEAMVGFFNAWQLTGDQLYLKYSRDAFDFIQTTIKDEVNGEWYWGIGEDGRPMRKEKAGFWKCPYHSVRACIEISKRIAV